MDKKKDVQKIAHLARLNISETDESAFQNHFNNILNFFSTLEQVDTHGIEPLITAHEMQNDLRKDKIRQKLLVDEILSNAPDVKNNLFKVPPVV